MPDSPTELLQAAEFLDEWRRFAERCGGTWPSLSEEIRRPVALAATLATVRGGARGRQLEAGRAR